LERAMVEVIIAATLIALTALSVPLFAAFQQRSMYACDEAKALQAAGLLASAASEARRSGTSIRVELGFTAGFTASGTTVTVNVGRASASVNAGVPVSGSGASSSFTVEPTGVIRPG